MQVCQYLTVGNWTLERDEDLTGPYSFLGNKWIAFDDDTSLKIKAKYVLLRDLAGVGLMSIDADDVDNVCGKGPNSLLTTLANVMTSVSCRAYALSDKRKNSQTQTNTLGRKSATF